MLRKGENDEGTELLKVEWEQQKWGVSWVLNDTQHRPPGPWREWKKKKVSTALVLTGEGGRDGGNIIFIEWTFLAPLGFVGR